MHLAGAESRAFAGSSVGPRPVPAYSRPCFCFRYTRTARTRRSRASTAPPPPCGPCRRKSARKVSAAPTAPAPSVVGVCFPVFKTSALSFLSSSLLLPQRPWPATDPVSQLCLRRPAARPSCVDCCVAQAVRAERAVRRVRGGPHGGPVEQRVHPLRAHAVGLPLTGESGWCSQL